MPDKLMLSSVEFHFLVKSGQPKDRLKLKAFLLQMFKKEKVAVDSLTYIFCNDEYLLGINKQFLQHDFYTDIITFNMSSRSKAVEGEIYISLDRVKENAALLKQPYQKELHRVIFHGVLHLCGYKDKTSKQEVEMRGLEDKYIKAYFK